MPLELKYHLKNLRNSLDFMLRSHFKFGRALPTDAPTPTRDLKLQMEIRDFLSLYNWKKRLEKFAHTEKLIVADIGARNFAFAPEIDRIFNKLNRSAEINGIEIDAHRLLEGFRSRKDYGEFYAAKIRDGHFYATDFLKWERPLHIAFFLNPFVSEEPTIDWGLPVKTLKPNQMFDHTHTLLSPTEGLMLLSSPSPEEYEIAFELAEHSGFKILEEQLWKPPKESVQQKARHGALFHA